MANNEQKYYPIRSDYSTHQQWQDSVNLHQHVYDLQDQLKAAQSAPPPKSAPAEFPNGPSNTKIAGLNVTGTPKGGQSLKYNALTGALEWS